MRCVNLIGSMLFICLTGTIAGIGHAADDPIAAAHRTSKDEYAATVAKARAELLKAIDNRILILRGNKKISSSELVSQLEQLNRGRKAFEEEGYLPEWPVLQKAVKEYKTSIRRAEEKCRAAYKKAISAYRNQENIDKAIALVEEEKNYFLKLPMAIIQSPADLSQFAIVAGEWRIQDNELVQSSTDVASPAIFFGSPEWVEYDAQVDVYRKGGQDAATFYFRAANEDHSLAFLGGANSGRETHIHVNHYTATDVVTRENCALPAQKWFTLKIHARGNQFKGELLDGDRVLSTLKWKVDEYDRGMIGLGTWYSSYRFKNILVTSPEGKILWKGLPALPN